MERRERGRIDDDPLAKALSDAGISTARNDKARTRRALVFVGSVFAA
jgi:hypothetical protein